MWWVLALVACGGAGELVGLPGSEPAKPKLEVGQVGSGPGSQKEIVGEVLSSSDCDSVTSDPLAPDACLTGTLKCGDTVVGNTKGGINRFDTRFYEQYFCTPATTDHNDGGERVYELILPDGDQHADIYMDTPCADLDLAAMKWDGEGCPDKTSQIDVCEMNRQKRNGREHVRLVSRGGSRWLIVVEGEGAAEGAFGLKVECNAGL